MQSGLRLRDAGLRLQRGRLCLRRLVLRLGAVQRRLADVLLLIELPLALDILGRHVQQGLRLAQLRVARTRRLFGSAGVDARQHLAGLDRLAGLDLQRGDRAGNLRCHRCLPDGLDHAVEAAEHGALAAAYRRRGQRRGGCRCHRRLQEQAQCQDQGKGACRHRQVLCSGLDAFIICAIN